MAVLAPHMTYEIPHVGILHPERMQRPTDITSRLTTLIHQQLARYVTTNQDN
jgi:hypothetical protein